MNETVKDRIYSTRSLQVAAFLFSRPESDGVKLVGFNSEDTRNIMFEFKPFDKCADLNDDYLMDNVDCKPRKIMEAHATLKEKVFMIQRSAKSY